MQVHLDDPTFRGSILTTRNLALGFGHISSEDLYTLSMVMMFRKNSHYVRNFDVVLQRLIEGGLIQKWSLDEFRKKVKPGGQNGVLQLSVWDLKGLFCIYALGYLIAIVVFVIERKRGIREG